MFENLFGNKKAVKEEVAGTDSQKKIEELEWKVKSLEQENEQLLLDRKEFMDRASQDAKMISDQTDKQADVDKLIEMNKNSEKKIATLSEENQKLKSQIRLGESNVKADSESEKELRLRNGIQSDTIHKQMLEISGLKNKIKS